MLGVDADGAFKLEEKRGLVAGVAEISRWLEPEPNPTHFSLTATKFVRPVHESSLSMSQGIQNHILDCWWDQSWDRVKQGNVNVGSVKHCIFSRADPGSVPGETSSHLNSATRPQQGGSERPGCLPIPALSGHFPTTPHLDGLRQHGQKGINALISEDAERKNTSWAVGSGKLFLWIFPGFGWDS